MKLPYKLIYLSELIVVFPWVLISGTMVARCLYQITNITLVNVYVDLVVFTRTAGTS